MERFAVVSESVFLLVLIYVSGSWVLWRLLALWYCISLGAASWRTSVHYDNIFPLLVVVRWSMLVGNGSLGLLAVGSTLGRLRSCNLHSLWVSGAHAGSGENSVFDFGPLFGLVVVDRGWFPPPPASMDRCMAIALRIRDSRMVSAMAIRRRDRATTVYPFISFLNSYLHLFLFLYLYMLFIS